MTIKKQPSAPDFGHLSVEEQKILSRQQWESSKKYETPLNEKLPREGKKRLDVIRALAIS